MGQQPPQQQPTAPYIHQTHLGLHDTFDSLNPDDIRPFLLQCELTFNSYPQQLSSDKSKVFFSISHMKKMALEWFEQGAMENDLIDAPLWWFSWKGFIIKLCTNFVSEPK